MCEYSGKLIAWLDRELPADEAAGVERHLRSCIACHNELIAFERLSGALESYCEAAWASSAPRGIRGGKAAAVGAGAIAAMIALLLAPPRTREARPRLAAPQEAVAASPAPSAAEAARVPSAAGRIHRAHRQPVAAPAQNEDTAWQAAQPAVQITIPAEAVLPPGAAPEGVSFVAEVSFAADGSAQEFLLRP